MVQVSKVRSTEYSNARSQLNAINRKQTGSLAARDLSNLVKPEDIITSEHLVTLLAVVPKYSQKDWLSSYETLTTYVVPRSSKKLHEGSENALYTVTLFGKVAGNFKTSAREKGFQIREFEYSPEAQEGRKQELEKLMQDQVTMRSSLLQWCYASYGEVETVEGYRDLQVPSGTQPGETLMFANMGVPNINIPSVRGDHHFIVRVEIPKTISRSMSGTMSGM